MSRGKVGAAANMGRSHPLLTLQIDEPEMRIRNGRPLLVAAATAFLLAACGGADGGADGRRATANDLEVGGLPVTCNLSLPVACMAMQNADMSPDSAAKVSMAGMDMGD